ncbi:ABC transporter permease [Larkinella soli]|uniref:ABC transporter permease n=1 Tax=Larkinella soli TaxID=1770527 RepID=UPI000FFBF5AA|nr:ABC transporter permease [Larkinella soli]
MVRNTIKTAWRNLLRNRGYALINVTGLTLGLGVAIVLFWIVRFEYGFDRHHALADRLFRIQAFDKFGKSTSHVPQGVIKALREQVPGVEKAANVQRYSDLTVKAAGQVFNMENVFFAPADFFEMIDLEWVQGSPRRSLIAPGQVALDEPTARRLFGSVEKAMGQPIVYDTKITLTVGGIFRKVPANSDFQFQFVMPRLTLLTLNTWLRNENYWSGGDSWHHGYVLLKPGVAPERIADALTRLAQQHTKESNYVRYGLETASESHRNPANDPFTYFMPNWMLMTLSGIGLFLIVIACINFINLATVQATRRSSEIAMRKVLGSSRPQLMAQFLGETALLVGVALGLGGLLAGQLIGYADQVLTTQVAQSEVWDGQTGLFLALLGVAVTALAGFYPAFVLSGFQPIRALRGRVYIPKTGISLRQVLVVTQFVIAQVLVICTLIGLSQIRYFYRKDLGFSRTAVVRVRLPDKGNPVVRERFRQQLLQHPAVREVTFGLTTPTSAYNHWWNTATDPHFPGGVQTVRHQFVDTNYFRFFRIPVLAGRTFTPADTNQVLIINEKTARDMGFRQPRKAVGARLGFNGDRFTVIGVVKDYYSQNLKEGVQPHVFVYAGWNFESAIIRFTPGQSAGALGHIERYWRSLFPANYFKYTMLDDEIRGFYESERRLSNFLTLFAAVGILIGSLGLLGLVAFVVGQRTKEIGVRKVLGATVLSIVSLLSKDFLKLVGVAFVIAVPIGWYAMDQWLQEYANRISIEWWVFALAGGLAGSFALITVSAQSVKAALMNPVKSLRSE